MKISLGPVHSVEPLHGIHHISGAGKDAISETRLVGWRITVGLMSYLTFDIAQPPVHPGDRVTLYIGGPDHDHPRTNSEARRPDSPTERVDDSRPS